MHLVVRKMADKRICLFSIRTQFCSLNLNSDNLGTRGPPLYAISFPVIQQTAQMSLGKLPSRFSEYAALKTGIVAQPIHQTALRHTHNKVTLTVTGVTVSNLEQFVTF
jgi:hypothetical protein